MQTISRYGWRKDKLDHRDHIFSLPAHIDAAALPPMVNLAPQCPAIDDQQTIGSCTAHGIGEAVQFLKPLFKPSRLMIYYDERVMEHTVKSDAGAEIRDGIKSVAKQGVCPEALWPYDVSKFTKKPAAACYAAALKHRVTRYSRVAQTEAQLCGCLAAGLPFVFGFSVFAAFESAEVASTGIVPMPSATDAPIGGHCALCVGFDATRRMFFCMNSWGKSFGIAGYFWIPNEYLLNPSLASDFWVIQGTA